MSEPSESINRGLWEDRNGENESDYHNPLPVQITGALTQEQLIAYQIMFRIHEITSLLFSNGLKPPERRHRSPSPPPMYDARGKRINTKEQRYRKKLEEERHRLVEIALRLIPHFVAPEDYKRPSKFQDKYYIPVDQYPGINFVGLLLGPRGNTLRKLQEDSGCKIAIRGRGSVKEGKNSYDLPKGAMNFSDPLHCLVIADNEEKIQHGMKLCESIVIKAVTSPEGQNELKRGQLRELAELNGILREDNRPCPICGLQGHRKYECPNRETFAQKIICRRCGQAGHVTIDCTANMPSFTESRYSRYNATEDARDNQERSGRSAQRYSSNAHGTTSYRSRYSRTNQDSQGLDLHPSAQYVEEEFQQDTDTALNLPPGLEPTNMPGIPGMSPNPHHLSKQHSLEPASESPAEGDRAALMNLSPVASTVGGIPGLVTAPGMESSPLGLSGPPGLPTSESFTVSDLQTSQGVESLASSDVKSTETLQGPPGFEAPPSQQMDHSGNPNSLTYQGSMNPGQSEPHSPEGIKGPPGL